MAHLFAHADYYDFRSKAHNNIKKNLEAKVELLT